MAQTKNGTPATIEALRPIERRSFPHIRSLKTGLTGQKQVLYAISDLGRSKPDFLEAFAGKPRGILVFSRGIYRFSWRHKPVFSGITVFS
jgi:hypothetical protein